MVCDSNEPKQLTKYGHGTSVITSQIFMTFSAKHAKKCCKAKSDVKKTAKPQYFVILKIYYIRHNYNTQ